MKKILYIVIAMFLSIAASAQVDRTVQPKPGADPKINLGKPQQFTLPNGLTVLVVENHKLPRVSFTLTLDNPPSLEGEIKGVDDLTSSMMGNGTSKISKDEFNKKIDFYGAYASFNVYGVSATTLSRYFPDVLALAAQGALDPLFTQDELDSEKAKLINGLKTQEKSAQAIARQVRRTLLYGQAHPKGEPLKEESINKVTLADVKKCYKDYFVPENAYLVIVGDVKFADVKKLVTANFSSWKKAPAPKSSYSEPVNLKASEINIVDVPNAVQSEISVNNLISLKMTDPDYFAALLANHILGGGGEGRLFLNLREAHGWTYGSYSGIQGDKYMSDFTAQASVRNAVTDSAVVEILNEVKKIRTELPTQQELDLAKAKYIGSFVMNAEKPQTIASFALRIKTQKLPDNFYQDYIKKVNAVTLEEVQAAAKKHMSFDNTRIVIVGKATEITPALERLNIPIKYFDKFGNPAAKPEVKTVSGDVSAQSVLQKYIDAVGGAAAMNNVKTVSLSMKATIQGQTISINGKQTADGKSLQEMSAMGMTMMKSVCDGKTGYIIVQGQKQELAGDELENMKKPIFPELSQLNSDKAQLAGIENINGADAYKVMDGNSTSFYDVKSGLKIAEETTREANGRQMTTRTYLNDYKEVNGVKFPFKHTTNMMGMDVEMTTDYLKVNEDVSDADFK
ncbi:pitrilysin family protein [Dysgonomonas sp. 25]|uniref:M16 family metallopeptidase n=1 Tax=Dysgonomonas sp. 25 TaxID=2302933 RepID=UPI0013D02D26|nr:pitrilysin family protein [Dysgonomonas sp. 25]NDV70338.1 insulinase family protein [Dysgonomonas sp. 25]